MAEKKPIEENLEFLVRIMGYDIPGEKSLYTGLTRIKGVSWSISNAVCKKLKMNKKTKISSLPKDDIKKIEAKLNDLDIASYLKNRKNDPESGEDKHIVGIKLDLRRDFDIKRLKQIKSYRGNRHSLKLPTRGQRTRSHFRKSGIAVGVKRPKVGKKS